jgi:adenylate kinase
MSQPKVIILFGPPGAGKGIQAWLLAERLSFYYLEASKIIEQNIMGAKPGEFVSIGGKRYSLVRERRLWKSGILCSPPVVSYWVKGKIRQLLEEEKGIIMAGSPRTMFEAQDQIPFLKERVGVKNIRAILIEISPEETVWRNSHRRICELQRHPILYSKETSRLRFCPLDGSPLVRRKGLDDPKTITVRLREYQERTFPIIDYIQNQKIKVTIVDGEQTPARVHRDIVKAIRK